MRDDRGVKRPIAWAAVVVIVFTLLMLAYNSRRPEEVGGDRSVVYGRNLMGTMVEFTLAGGDRESFDAAAEAGFREISRLERLLSSYDPESDVSRVNAAAGEGPVEVSPEVAEVVSTALEISRLTGGAFDPTVGSLAGAWGWSGEKGVVPAPEELEPLLARVDYRKVELDPGASTVALAEEGMALNLGGVAKGYIVGRAIEALKEKGVTRGIVKAGGDMTVFDTAGGGPFIIGIRHPREGDALMGTVSVATGAVTTSGDYERFFMKDGVRYHHILDPSTGYPAEGTRSVTIVSEDPAWADALSTGVFVMGPREGMELVEGLDGVEAVIVNSTGKVTRSSGFTGEVYGEPRRLGQR